MTHYETSRKLGPGYRSIANPPSRAGTLRRKIGLSLSIPIHSPLPFSRPASDWESSGFLNLLGEGAFARVYLAEHETLRRQVALKVARHFTPEAQTLAQLDHPHILPVYSSSIDRATGLHWVCMRYVAGTSLDRLIEQLFANAVLWNGQDFLDSVKAFCPKMESGGTSECGPPQVLATCDRNQAVCHLGVQLAEALGYVHVQGILHRDIKPGNILVDFEGNPFLADFNLAKDSQVDSWSGNCRFGGSLGYMSPEHLEAFFHRGAARAAGVDARSDVFSLGVVLYELLSGQRPWPSQGLNLDEPQAVERLLANRRQQPFSLSWLLTDLPPALETVVHRCLARDPHHRYQTAGELAEALDDVRHLLQIHRGLPNSGPFHAVLRKSPFRSLIGLLLFPQLIGSLTNITYNATQIVSQLTPDQRNIFLEWVWSYNVTVYPMAVLVITWLLASVYRVWNALQMNGEVCPQDVAAARRQCLCWGNWVIGLSCAGWLPGMLLFPLAIHHKAGPLAGSIYGHFIASFSVSCLISLTYSWFAAQTVAIEILYPHLWLDVKSPSQTAARELGPVKSRLLVFQVLAGVIPLFGALLLIVSAPEHFRANFRWLVCGLLFAGSAGFTLAMLLVNRLHNILELFLGKETDSKPHPDRARRKLNEEAADAGQSS